MFRQPLWVINLYLLIKLVRVAGMKKVEILKLDHRWDVRGTDHLVEPRDLALIKCDKRLKSALNWTIPAMNNWSVLWPSSHVEKERSVT